MTQINVDIGQLPESQEENWNLFIRTRDAKKCHQCTELGYYRLGEKKVYCRQCWGKLTGQWPDGKPSPTQKFSLGDRVRKEGGDYSYEGIVVSIVHKLSGEIRYVVENKDGMLFIFNEKSLTL